LSARAFADLVAIGLVVKPQGRKGEVLAHPLSDRPDRFPELRRVYVPGPGGAAREMTVTSCWPHKGRFVLKLEGVDSIDAAEGFRGLELRIGEEELAPLPEGSFYLHEIVGLRAEDASGRDLGTVADLQPAGEAPVLVLRGPAGERLVPFAEPFVRAVDREHGRLVLDPPEDADDAAHGAAGGRA
jgi:16S rRNA processing protein RimM